MAEYEALTGNKYHHERANNNSKNLDNIKSSKEENLDKILAQLNNYRKSNTSKQSKSNEAAPTNTPKNEYIINTQTGQRMHLPHEWLVEEISKRITNPIEKVKNPEGKYTTLLGELTFPDFFKKHTQNYTGDNTNKNINFIKKYYGPKLQQLYNSIRFDTEHSGDFTSPNGMYMPRALQYHTVRTAQAALPNDTEEDSEEANFKFIRSLYRQNRPHPIIRVGEAPIDARMSLESKHTGSSDSDTGSSGSSGYGTASDV